MLIFLAKQKEKKDATLPTSSDQSLSESASLTVPSDIYEDEDIDPVIYFDGKAYSAKKNIESVLFIGIDSFGEPEEHDGYSNKDQADVLMLIVIDHDLKTYNILQINRDTMAEIRLIGSTGDDLGTGVTQIAFSHTYGSGLNDSCEYTAEAVSTLLYDSEIEHYISLPMDSIAIINESVGGVTVKVPYDMTMVDPNLVEGQEVKLDAAGAEHFVRSRMGLDEPTNISRMERQLTYLSAWKTLAVSKMNADPGFALNLIGDLSNYMVTDMDLNELSELSTYLSEYENQGMIKLDGDSREGEEYMEFYVYEKSLKEAIVKLYYDESEN